MSSRVFSGPEGEERPELGYGPESWRGRGDPRFGHCLRYWRGMGPGLGRGPKSRRVRGPGLRHGPNSRRGRRPTLGYGTGSRRVRGGLVSAVISGLGGGRGPGLGRGKEGLGSGVVLGPGEGEGPGLGYGPGSRMRSRALCSGMVPGPSGCGEFQGSGILPGLCGKGGPVSGVVSSPSREGVPYLGRGPGCSGGERGLGLGPGEGGMGLLSGVVLGPAGKGGPMLGWGKE
ncbi:hypothetical protein FXO38_28404 [Capsicum annuum]|nr:hypothetical protein FXO38_28404 [Capsicum annuum]